MSKIALRRPILIMLYGFPGSGKTKFARSICEVLKSSYVSTDRIRGELFEKPRYDKAEDSIVNHLLEYMTEEFLGAGVSVVLDANVHRRAQRRHLQELAKRQKAEVVLVWFQIDPDAAYLRTIQRDRRKTDDKYARTFERPQFDEFISTMQHPDKTENCVVLSGKHSFLMQRSGMLRKLFDMNLMSPEDVSRHVVKPGMVNLVPANQQDGRRNINIH